MAEGLGERIRLARIALRWSQVQLAEKSGVSRTVISDIERGENNNPSIRTLLKLARALGIPLPELLKNIDPLSHR